MRPVIILIIGVFAVSWAAIFARLAAVIGYIAAWWRLLVGSIILLLYISLQGKKIKIDRYSVAAGIALATHFSLWLESLNHMSIASSTGIVVSYPAILLPFEFAVLKERFMKHQVIGIVMTLIGIYILSQPWSGATPIGALLAFLAAVAGSIYFQIGRVVGRSGRYVASYVSSVYLIALITTTLICIIMGANPVTIPIESILYLILMGLITMAIGHTAINYALKFYPATLVTTALIFEPFGATMLGWVVLRETPCVIALVGITITISGIIIALHRPGYQKYSSIWR